MEGVFLKFLEANNCKQEFIQNFDCNFGFIGNVSIDKFFTTVSKDNYVAEAFGWSRSLEGHDFWETVHHKWTKPQKFKANKLNKKLYKDKIYFETEEIIYVKS